MSAHLSLLRRPSARATEQVRAAVAEDAQRYIEASRAAGYRPRAEDAVALLEQGLSEQAVAEQLGVSQYRVNCWRHEAGLPEAYARRQRRHSLRCSAPTP